MPLEAGEAVYSDELEESRDDSNVSAGDVAAIAADGSLAAADTESNDVAGVVTEAGNLGLGGVFVAAASGVSDGEHVGAGNATGGTTGQFITSSGGPGLALSDVGGTWRGYDVPAGYAVVQYPR